MKRRDFIKATGAAAVGAAASLSFPKFLRYASASDPIKIGALFSSSGTMANIEGRLTHICRMAAEEINAKGGVLGRPVETIGVDPASDWPLYAQLGRQLLLKDKVAAMSNWGDVLELLKKSHGDGAKVVVYPSADIQYFES